MEIEDVVKVHSIGYGLEDVKVEFKHDLKMDVSGVQIEGKENEMMNIPRWVANILESEKYIEIQDVEERYLRKWHEADPVDSFERRRNNMVEKFQGNRNPFIDNPAFATVIWGGDDATDIWGVLLSTEEFQVSAIKMYPNPVNGEIINIKTQKELQVEIFDVLGKKVISTEVNKNLNTINVSTLSKGLYLVKLKSSAGIITKKMIKQ